MMARSQIVQMSLRDKHAKGNILIQVPANSQDAALVEKKSSENNAKYSKALRNITRPKNTILLKDKDTLYGRETNLPSNARKLLRRKRVAEVEESKKPVGKEKATDQSKENEKPNPQSKDSEKPAGGNGTPEDEDSRSNYKFWSFLDISLSRPTHSYFDYVDLLNVVDRKVSHVMGLRDWKEELIRYNLCENGKADKENVDSFYSHYKEEIELLKRSLASHTEPYRPTIILAYKRARSGKPWDFQTLVECYATMKKPHPELEQQYLALRKPEENIDKYLDGSMVYPQGPPKKMKTRRLKQ